MKPDFAETHNNLGIALKAQGKLEEAAIHYQHALGLKPDFAQAHNNLCTVLREQGRTRGRTSGMCLAYKFVADAVTWGFFMEDDIGFLEMSELLQFCHDPGEKMNVV